MTDFVVFASGFFAGFKRKYLDQLVLQLVITVQKKANNFFIIYLNYPFIYMFVITLSLFVESRKVQGLTSHPE